MKRFAFSLAFMLGISALASGVATGNQELMTVRISAESLAMPLQLDRGTLGEAVGSLTAAVNGRVCAAVSLTGPSNRDSAGNKVLILGTVDQPNECRLPTPGSKVFFIDERGRRLVAEVPYEPGGDALVRNLAPQPPHSAEYGLLLATLSVSGQLVTGTGAAEPGLSNQALLIVPTTTEQPIGLPTAFQHMYEFEPDGEVHLALPVGDYLIAYAPADHQLTSAPEILVLADSRVFLRYPAFRMTVSPGETLTLALEAVPEPVFQPGPGITPPTVGDGGLR